MKALNIDKGIRAVTNIFLIVSIVMICYTLQSIIVPILFSIILMVLLLPLCERLEKWGLNRVGASFIALAFATLLILGIGYLIVSQTVSIGRDALDIADKLNLLLKDIIDWAAGKFNMSETQLLHRIETEFGNRAYGIINYLTAGLSSLGSSLSSFLLVPILLFFFLYYRQFFKEFFYRAFSSFPREKVAEVLAKIYDVLRNYLTGLVIVMGIVTILNTIGLLMLGIEYAWFFGVLAAILTIFPYIGIFIGSLVPALFALATKDSAFYAVGIILWFQVVQLLEGNYITPKIVGGKASLNPLVSLLSFFLGGMLFGIAGMILALPILAMLKVIFDAMPSTSAYGFLLSEPDESYILTEKQISKKRAASKEKSD